MTDEITIEKENTTENMIDAIQADDLNGAGKMFNDIIGTKIAAAIDQQKVKISQSVYSDAKGKNAEAE